MAVNKSILGILSELGANLKTASVKKAADVPTSHPVGKVEDGQPATSGFFEDMNTQTAKKNGGPTGVEASTDVNPTAKGEDNPNQVSTTTAADAPPAEAKPAKTVTGGDSDTDAGTLGGSETAGGRAEGEIAGVGGPKFASKQVLSDLDAYLKNASALLPVVDAAPAAPAVKQAADADLIDASDAEELAQAEKMAAQVIANALAAVGIAADAPLAQKRAALVRLTAKEASNHADGFVASQDPSVLARLLGTNKQAAEGEDPAAAMPPGAEGPAADPAGDPVAAGGAPGGDPAGGQNPEQLIEQIVQAIQSGELPAEEGLQMLQELGVPQEILAQLAAALGGQGGAGGGEAGAGGAAGAAGGAGAASEPGATATA